MARVDVNFGFGKAVRSLPRFSAPAPRLIVAKAAHPVPLVAGLLKMKFNAGMLLLLDARDARRTGFGGDGKRLDGWLRGRMSPLLAGKKLL